MRRAAGRERASAFARTAAAPSGRRAHSTGEDVGRPVSCSIHLKPSLACGDEPRRNRQRASFPKKPSTASVLEQKVGVQWRGQRNGPSAKQCADGNCISRPSKFGSSRVSFGHVKTWFRVLRPSVEAGGVNSSFCISDPTAAGRFKPRPLWSPLPSQRPMPPSSLPQKPPEARSGQDREPRRRSSAPATQLLGLNGSSLANRQPKHRRVATELIAEIRRSRSIRFRQQILA